MQDPVLATEPGRAVRAFFDKLSAGDTLAAAESLSPAFRDRLGLGDAARARRLREKSFGFKTWKFSGPADDTLAVYSGRAEGSARFNVRAAKLDGKWLVDQFLVTDLPPATVPQADGPAALAARVATHFLDTLLTPQPTGERYLTDAAAAELAPELRTEKAPPFASDKDGYNAGRLRTWLNGPRGRYTGYTVEKVEVAGEAVSVTGTLRGRSGDSAYQLTLRRGAGGWKLFGANLP